MKELIIKDAKEGYSLEEYLSVSKYINWKDDSMYQMQKFGICMMKIGSLSEGIMSEVSSCQ